MPKISVAGPTGGGAVPAVHPEPETVTPETPVVPDVPETAPAGAGEPATGEGVPAEVTGAEPVKAAKAPRAAPPPAPKKAPGG